MQFPSRWGPLPVTRVPLGADDRGPQPDPTHRQRARARGDVGGAWHHGGMPEMPEVEGLVEYLRGRVTGLRVEKATVSAINALKTYDPPLTSLVGSVVTAVDRHGKFVDVSTDAGVHLIFHLAKAGWLRWYDALPATIIKPG